MFEIIKKKRTKYAQIKRTNRIIGYCRNGCRPTVTNQEENCLRRSGRLVKKKNEYYFLYPYLHIAVSAIDTFVQCIGKYFH